MGIVKYNYVNFNYTNIFDNCIEILKKDATLPLLKKANNSFITYANNEFIGNVFHIHGTLNNEMILGVDNLNQISNSAFRNIKVINQIIKPKTNDSLENQNNETMKRLIQASSIYIVFGMSIGATDKTWWNEIAKQMLGDKTKRLVIFTYNGDSDFSLPTEKISQSDLWKTQFLNQVELSDDKKAEIEQRISIAINKKIFDIKLV
jgi:hypothetical protein